MAAIPWVRRFVHQRRAAAWMPYEGASNRAWLLSSLGKRIQPEWTQGQWQVSRRHLWTLVDALADRFGQVEVKLEFRLRQRCDERCRQANPASVYDCVCSCLGKNHGGTGADRSWRPAGQTMPISDDVILWRFRITQGDIPAYLLTPTAVARTFGEEARGA